MASPTRYAPPPGDRPSEEPIGLLDLVPPPETHGVDEAWLAARDPFTLFAWWELTPGGLAAARAALGEDGTLVVRLFPGDIDHELDAAHGRRYLPAPEPGAHVSAAAGLRAKDGRFLAIAHAARVHVPWSGPATPGPVEWVELRVTGSGRAELVSRGTTAAPRYLPGTDATVPGVTATASSPARPAPAGEGGRRG